MLEKTRVKDDLIQTFSILKDFENVDREEFFELDIMVVIAYGDMILS